ncbi:succinic semialdehyde dehydrogenase [Arthrobacter sp. CJ23]|uniref:succinic semialdehyde dehydrogenase n=1 Tax=Arthrobacter sp. CJ23 TaxID=2972479 RepID=UPI00215C67C5|nr:succinic semialdehyde dehydrogenase [Arthrobacter sp. CJ23]UVJ40116.1 succinic semialdehyde dehydrogenase [Arthrobacter sp. CJ23]
MTKQLPAGTRTPAITSHPGSYAGLSSLVSCQDGRPQQSSSSPFDGTHIGDVPLCTPEDAERAVEGARAAQRAWAAVPIERRRRVIRRFHDLLHEQQEDILDIVQAETGKARISAYEEFADVALTASYYARTAARHLRSSRRRGAMPLLTRTVEHQVPKGVIGIISPWNYPLTLAVSDAIPALLAGNGVVLKPDSQTPFTALRVLKLMLDAGLPPALFQIVTGTGSTLGPALIGRVDYLMFTGSTRTGKTVAKQCAERLIGFSAELGGKNPMLVLADADVARTAEGAVQACFSNAGQLCVSIERLYVHDDVYERFMDAFIKQVERMRLGAGRDWEIDMGSLISQQQLDTVGAHVEDALSKGAQLITGGHPRPELGPLFYEPTVLGGVTADMLLARSETFGPVVAVYRVRDDEEAIALANDTDFGLNASVWSTPEHGASVARRLQAGTVNINEGYAAAWASHDAPMGGMKDSGAGRRHGREGILKYTESQTVALQRLIPVGPTPGLSHKRYAQLMTRAVKILGRLP